MSVGATSAAYLASRGLGLGEIAALKSLQAAIFLFCEFPTGIFADLAGRWISLLLGILTSAGGFLLFYFSSSFAGFLCAEALTALSLCFWSGAYEAFVIERASLEAEEGAIDGYFHLNHSVSQIGVLVAGVLGGLVGAKSLALPYLIGFASSLLGLALLLVLRSSHGESRMRGLGVNLFHVIATKTREHVKVTWSAGLANRELIPFFMIMVLVQAFIQPLLHFWQPFFLSMGPQIGSRELGFIFAGYSGLSVLTGMLLSSVSRRPFFRSSRATLMLFFCTAVFYSLIGRTENCLLAVIFFCLTQATLATARTSLGARFNERIAGSVRASILSLNSMISRIGMILSLNLLGSVLAGGGEREKTIFNAYGIAALTLTGTALLALVIYKLLAPRTQPQAPSQTCEVQS